MKEKIFGLSVGVLVALVVVGCFALLKRQTNGQFDPLGVYAGDSFNTLSSVTHTPTTTPSNKLPVKLLSSNTNRSYAHIQNTSASPVYIYLGSFTDSVAASTTVSVSTGIYLPASGGTYEFLPEKHYTGEVWASSTLINALILVTEK